MLLDLTIVIISMKAAVAFFSASLLLAKSGWRRDHVCFLAFFLCLYGFINFNELFLIMGGFAIAPHLMGVVFPLELLLAPAMYFYARAITSEKTQWLTTRDSTSLIAPIIAFVVAIPFYSLSAEQKIELMSPQPRDIEIYERAILGSQIGFVLFLVVSLAYLVASYILFRRHSKRLRDLFSRIDDKTISWLRWILLILALGWSTYAIVEFLFLIDLRSQGVYGAFHLFELAWIVVIAFFGIGQQSVYPEPIEENMAEVAEVYSNSSLTQHQLDEIAKQLESVMQQKQLYLDPELSLHDLSAAIGVRGNNISETFSRHFSKNFYDYVNAYRVDKACELLKSSSSNTLSIALEAGFNSRSTFNSAFKRTIGKTPSQYRKNNPATS